MQTTTAPTLQLLAWIAERRPTYPETMEAWKSSCPRLTVWEEVRRINSGGTTIFLTTQYLEEADELCQRLAIIDHGELVAQGTPESLKAEIGKDVVSVELHGADADRTREVIGELPGLDRVIAEQDALALFVDDGASSIAQIVRRLDSADVEVGAISVSRPSLDDVFLEATGRRLEGAQQEQEHADEAAEEDEAAAKAVAP